VVAVGLGQIALNSAPVFGGVLLAVAAGQFRGPDYRGSIQQDMELLDRLPAEDVARRAELRRTIDERIDDLIDASHRNHALRKAATSYEGNWRDSVLLLCVVLFTIVWWNVDHSRSNWLVTFILLILVAVVTAAYALRGVLRATLRRRRDDDQRQLPPGADASK
jgi:multisubunit Na+/H+ antiporter MnhG subunit